MKTICLTLLAFALASVAAAQEGSLTHARPVAAVTPGAPTLASTSFIYQALPPETMDRPLEKESIITVLVDYRSVMMSEGSGEAIKIGNFNASLTDWIGFDGKSIFAAPQRRGDPTVSGTLNSQMRAESEIEQRESLTFAIAAKIVDIRPNGNLVIEGVRSVRVNEEVWKIYLTGTAPRQGIGPDRTIRDTSIADLRVEKYEVGAVRDGYARGWLGRFYGKYKAL